MAWHQFKICKVRIGIVACMDACMHDPSIRNSNCNHSSERKQRHRASSGQVCRGNRSLFQTGTWVNLLPCNEIEAARTYEGTMKQLGCFIHMFICAYMHEEGLSESERQGESMHVCVKYPHLQNSCKHASRLCA